MLGHWHPTSQHTPVAVAVGRTRQCTIEPSQQFVLPHLGAISAGCAHVLALKLSTHRVDSLGTALAGTTHSFTSLCTVFLLRLLLLLRLSQVPALRHCSCFNWCSISNDRRPHLRLELPNGTGSDCKVGLAAHAAAAVLSGVGPPRERARFLIHALHAKAQLLTEAAICCIHALWLCNHQVALAIHCLATAKARATCCQWTAPLALHRLHNPA